MSQPVERLKHPVTSEVDYSQEDIQFMKAMTSYSRICRRVFPTLREILAVARSCGYRRVADPTPLPKFGGACNSENVIVDYQGVERKV